MDRSDLARLRPPDRAGVYLFHDAQDRILYVGKALSLRRRLPAYFRASEQLDPKTRALMARAVRLEFMVTDSEVEALILENTLIKKHQPRYNVLLRDDKTYPFLKLTMAEPFPRLLMTRRPTDDGARYFGPFTQGSLRDLARVLSLHFGLRLCQTPDFKPGRPPARPCLYAQLGACDAVCRGEEGPEAYARRVRAALDFLEGREDTVTPALTDRMQRAARAQDFESAARLRDQLRLAAEVRHKPLAASPGREDRDALGLARSGSLAAVEFFSVRGGRLEGRRRFFLQHVGAETDAALVSRVLAQYYLLPVSLPPEILVPVPPEDGAALRDWLRRRSGQTVRLHAPRSGEARRLLKLAETNAWLHLRGQAGAPDADGADPEARGDLADLAARLGLPAPPVRIEGYDVSNLAGGDAVASRVVFIQGEPAPSEYRRYRIRSVPGPNDPAMLQEALYRRLRRQAERGEAPPDLLVVDGGAGQVSAARAVLRELKLEHLPVLGLAKRLEEVHLPGRAAPLTLPRQSPGLRLLMRLRDEAHRFAVAYHRVLRSKRLHVSALDRVPGLGPERRRALLRRFGSVEALLQVSEGELAATPGVGPKLAHAIRSVLAGRRERA